MIEHVVKGKYRFLIILVQSNWSEPRDTWQSLCLIDRNFKNSYRSIIFLLTFLSFVSIYFKPTGYEGGLPFWQPPRILKLKTSFAVHDNLR